MQPRVGTKLWFGPRRFGWGWSPVSWEGWAVVGVFFVVCAAATPRGENAALGVVAVAVAGLFGVIVLKGTDAGGPKAAAEFRRRRRGGP